MSYYMPTNGVESTHSTHTTHASHPSHLNGVTNGMAVNGVTKLEPNEAVKMFWKEHAITVHGRDPPLPVLAMQSYKWPAKISEALEADGFTHPTPIQCQSWPIALSGRDLVGVAQTGSGKTLCYVMPAFLKIMRDRPQRGPKCLVLAPTRELAQQIQAVVRRYRFANNVCLYGGASRGPQLRSIRETSPQIIIATPGRMIDFVESGAVDLKAVDYLVLDEADRMLDMGFEPQLKKILTQLPRERQTLMWSATWPKEVRNLAANYMKDYIQINVGGIELTANKNIKQMVEICDEYEKKQKLIDLLTKIRADSRENKSIIFAETKRKVNELANELRNSGWPSACIHGDKPQNERDWVLKEFRTGRSPILVATDVAARGLDVDDIKFVINYDYPNSTEDYVHRIGRTGRFDKKGTAFTFFTPANGKQANELIEVLKESEQTIEPKLHDLAHQSRYMAGNKRRRYGTGSYSNNSYSNGYSNGYSSGGGFKRKFDDRSGGSGGPAAKRPVRREYDSSSKPSRFSSSSNSYNSYSSSQKSSTNSYGSSTTAPVTQSRFSSWD